MTPPRGTPPPVRVVHLGLGGFFRAHQAWYTGASDDAAGWGIAAFTGRSRTLADALNRQQGLYTLVVRGSEGDEMSVQRAVARAHPGSDLETWSGYLAHPDVALVTLTVTEAAYARRADGGPDMDREDILADVAAVRRGEDVTTVPGRIVAGLATRRTADAGPLAVVSCDNVPQNGELTAGVVTGLAEAADPALAGWIREHVSFVSTMVDRITPHTTPDDVSAVAERTGWHDAVPVVTEPFTEWVLGGSFPSGRPAWETAGAAFVEDVHPYETRKLLLLNGGHSLLAYAGSERGHETIAQAVADEECRRWLEEWWDEAVGHVPLPAADLAEYRAALLQRFSNPRIRHTLAQIAADGSQKLPIRLLPVLRAERAAGRVPPGAVRILAAWIDHLRGFGAPVKDTGAGPYLERAGSVRDVIGVLAPDLIDDGELVAAVEDSVDPG